MEFENIYDMHTHSENSFDGNDSCILLCENAVARGLKGLAITDHLDIDGDDPDLDTFLKNQYTQCEIAKGCFKDKTEVFCGIELGQGLYRKTLSEEVLEKIPYDFVLGSVHNLPNVQDFYFMDFRKEDVPQRLTDYFTEELRLAKWNKTDSLAHLTYPLRYLIGKYGIRVDLTPYDDLINETLETLVKNQKALELNISSLFNYHYDTMPNREVIRRFHDMGGKYVTVGSDSHYAEKIGFGIDRGYEILLECGFKQFTVYRKREPYLINIE